MARLYSRALAAASLAVVLLCAVCAATSQPGRSLLDDPAPAPCQQHPTNSKCTTSPLLVSSLPAPKTRSEMLLAHYAALTYACGQHKAEPDCIADTQHFCEYQEDKATGAPRCVLSPVAVLQHGAEALLCEGSQVLDVYRCLLAPDCAAAPGCVALGEDKCMAAFQTELKGKAEKEWLKAFHKGKSSAWGKCETAVQFRRLFDGCVKHSEMKCLEQLKCEWSPRGAGRGGLCTPKLWFVEPALTGHKDGDFAKGFREALKACRNAAAPQCTANITFTPNPEALMGYADLATVTASPDSPMIDANGTLPSKKHHRKHKHDKHKHKHKHDHKHKEEEEEGDEEDSSSAAPVPADPAATLAATAAPTAGAPATGDDDDTPSTGAVALLVLASIAAIAIIAGAAYIAYTHIRKPRTSQYRPVMTADTPDSEPKKGGKATPPHEP